MLTHEAFNRSGLSRFLNRPAGRVFRVLAGLAFMTIGLVERNTVLGSLALAWSVLPLTAGAFDVCYVSAILGGPLSGRSIRQSWSRADRVSEK